MLQRIIMENDDTIDEREKVFHNTVRENVIFVLLFLSLFICTYLIIGKFRKSQIDNYFLSDKEDVKVYNISLLISTFSLTVAVGAVLLLPFSIASNEVLLVYSESYYIKWLNDSLVQGLWNHVFLFSNLSLFVFLPFAYFLTESEGFSGYSKGIKARIYETVILLSVLFGFLVGIVYLLGSFLDYNESFSIYSLFSFWDYNLRFLYSCVSFFGVTMLLLCTPLGFAHLFTVVSNVLVKPQFLKNIEDEYMATSLEEKALLKRLNNDHSDRHCSHILPSVICATLDKSYSEVDCVLKIKNGDIYEAFETQLEQIRKKLGTLESQRRATSLSRQISYPIAMIALLGLTVIAVLTVLTNTVELLIGFKALPISSRQFTLGISSLSKLGPLGATLEVVLILYLIATSTVGLYTIPPFRRIMPRLKSTPFHHVVANSVLLLVLSSALPLLSRILGITNFDLLGDFGKIQWLGNFYVVLAYNVVFIVTATVCLTRHATKSFCRELYSRVVDFCTRCHLRDNAERPISSQRTLDKKNS